MTPDPTIPPQLQLVWHISTLQHVLAAIVSRLSPEDAELVRIALEQAPAGLSGDMAVREGIDDVQLRAAVMARNDFRKLVESYKKGAPRG